MNWQDRENPQAGGAEIHLHEIFGRLAARGHEVTLLCGGWPNCPPRATLDGIDVIRVGHETHVARTRAARVSPALSRLARMTSSSRTSTRCRSSRPAGARKRVVALVPHLFGGTAFQELAAPLAAVVWLSERPLAWEYRGVPFHAISESTADDLVARGIRRDLIRVIYPGIDTQHYTPDSATAVARRRMFAYLGRLKRYKGIDLVIARVRRGRDPGRDAGDRGRR